MSNQEIDNCNHVDLAVLGTVVRVQFEDPGDRDAVVGPWHLCVMDQEAPRIPDRRVVTLRASSDPRAHQSALTSLTQAVTRAAIEEQSGHLLMFHAGALADLRTGASVIYVAPGGTGKTTLSATLGRGRGYITDETVAVTRSGDIVPYPKPLSTRLDSGGKGEVAPESLGLRPVDAAPWVAGLLSLRRDPLHTGDPHVRAVELLDAITVLSPEISALAQLDRPLQTCRDIIELAGGLLQVTYRESGQLEELFGEILMRERR